ncbi:SDR family NAD(P)-dependent oxidoreductase [Spirillospora sp. CA-142024]|uniref:SDR family NAD(P)-dependent oxidoreductase n=1 Tax=Spirillospora sp. CA-142024 TaxID=3240036 RepID=UPI003D917728
MDDTTTALVTGANKGIGYAVAAGLAARGMTVLIGAHDANLDGVSRVTNAMLPLLRRAPAGRIVNVSSGTSSMAAMIDPGHYFWDTPASAAYPASNAALNMLTIQYAKRLRDTRDPGQRRRARRLRDRLRAGLHPADRPEHRADRPAGRGRGDPARHHRRGRPRPLVTPLQATALLAAG